MFEAVLPETVFGPFPISYISLSRNFPSKQYLWGKLPQWSPPPPSPAPPPRRKFYFYNCLNSVCPNVSKASGNKSGAFGKPCLWPHDTRHFRRFTGFDQQNPCSEKKKAYSSEKKKAYTTTTERKSFGEFFWPQRETFQAGGGYKNPIKTKNHIHHRNLSSVDTIFSAKKSSALEQGSAWFLFPSLFYWLERKFVIFAVFVKTPSFWRARGTAYQRHNFETLKGCLSTMVSERWFRSYRETKSPSPI